MSDILNNEDLIEDIPETEEQEENDNKFYQPVSIDFTRSEYIKVNAKQFDTDRSVLVTCYNNGVLLKIDANEKVSTCRYKKPDGNFVWKDCEIISDKESPDYGKIKVPLDSNMLAVAGICYMDIMIAEKSVSPITGGEPTMDLSKGFVSSMLMCINVVASPVEGVEFDSSSDFNALVELIHRATEDYEYVIKESQGFADLSQNWAIGTPSGMREDEDTNNSKYWAEQSEDFANNSKQYSEDSESSADESKQYSENSQSSADESEAFANLSQNWAIGTPEGLRDDEATNNSKYWSDRAKLSEDAAADSATRADESDKNSAETYTNIIDVKNNALLEITQKQQLGYTNFKVDLDDGHLYYDFGYSDDEPKLYLHFYDYYNKTQDAYISDTIKIAIDVAYFNLEPNTEYTLKIWSDLKFIEEQKLEAIDFIPSLSNGIENLSFNIEIPSYSMETGEIVSFFSYKNPILINKNEPSEEITNIFQGSRIEQIVYKPERNEQSFVWNFGKKGDLS